MANFRTNASDQVAPNFQLIQLIQMVPPEDQTYTQFTLGHLVAKYATNDCNWRHLVAEFANNASGAMFLLNLIQVTESISGSVVPLQV